MGVGHSVSSLARIVGSGIGIPLLTLQLNMPYYVATGLMFLGVLLIAVAAKCGQDFAATAEGTTVEEDAAEDTEEESPTA